LPVDNQNRRKLPDTVTRITRPQSARPGESDGESAPHFEPRIASRPEDSDHRQSNPMVLSAGIVFLVAMAMHASNLWNVRNNIRELAGVSADLRSLAAHSDQLALVMDRHTRLHERNRPAPADTAPPAITALTRPPDIETRPIEVAREPAAAPSRSQDARGPAHPLVYGEWGPPLVPNYSKATRTIATRDAVTDRGQMQSDLLTLGFDVSADKASARTGAQTLQALDEFRVLYLTASGRQKNADNDRLSTSLSKYAALARKDAQKFGVESGILAAIRLGSRRTGVDFSFLMELAATESSFDPTSIAPITAAAGLYQFKDDTWLEAVRGYGNKYGMGVYALQVENYTDPAGTRRLRIQDPAVQEYVLALRHNPRLSALLAAEYVKLNRKQLTASLDREPGHTEMYLTHFFGASGAISFLKALAENPDRAAGEVFPIAAEHNRALFHPQQSRPRTIAEIYRMFERKFSRSRFVDANPS
jgi:hypothetical protein